MVTTNKQSDMTETLRVLVADDELGMRLGVCRTVSQLKLQVPEVEREVHFEVAEAPDGQAAIDRLESEPFDILLLDHKMPDLSGLDILEQLQQKEINVLTVMITGFASLETAVTATSRGAYDFLAKPFTPAALGDVLRKAATLVSLKKEVRRLKAKQCQTVTSN